MCFNYEHNFFSFWQLTLNETSFFQSDTFVSLLQTGQQQQSGSAGPQTAQGAPENRITVSTIAQDRLVGPTPKELDAFNELIQFDHVYYKPVTQSKSAPQNQGTPMQAIRMKKENVQNNKVIANSVQKVTGNGCKNVKIIITSDPSNMKNGKIGVNALVNEKIVTVPNMILDKDALQKVSNVTNSCTAPVSHSTCSENLQTVVPMDTVVNMSENTQSDDLMDLNFDLLEDLENIIKADFEGLTSSESDSLLSLEQDSAIADSPIKTDNVKRLKGTKRKSSDNHLEPVVDLSASVPSPTKSLSSFTDSDYLSDTHSPYSSHDIASPLGDTESSSLGDNLWEESFTELFPDLL